LDWFAAERLLALNTRGQIGWGHASCSGHPCGLLEGLTLDYLSDISGGGFLILSSDAERRCACGSASSRL